MDEEEAANRAYKTDRKKYDDHVVHNESRKKRIADAIDRLQKDIASESVLKSLYGLFFIA